GTPREARAQARAAAPGRRSLERRDLRQLRQEPLRRLGRGGGPRHRLLGRAQRADRRELRDRRPPRLPRLEGPPRQQVLLTRRDVSCGGSRRHLWWVETSPVAG